MECDDEWCLCAEGGEHEHDEYVERLFIVSVCGGWERGIGTGRKETIEIWDRKG